MAVPNDVATLQRLLNEANERIAAEAARADAAEARANAAEVARVAELSREMASVSLSRAPSPTTFLGDAALLRSANFIVGSPSKASEASVLDLSLACLDVTAVPLSPALQPLSAAGSLSRWAGKSSSELLHEPNAYFIAIDHLPSWIKVVGPRSGGAQLPKQTFAASTLFCPDPSGSRSRQTLPAIVSVELPWNCKPEMPTVVKEPFHPAYNGKFKSAMSAGDDARRLRMYDELLTYCMLAMMASFFDGVPHGVHRFFTQPPYAFGLAAFPHVGYLLAVEWVGKLLATVVSEPFYIGSSAHESAVRRLPDCDMSSCKVDLRTSDVLVSVWPEEEGKRPVVTWRVGPPPAGEPATGNGGSGNWFDVPEHAFFKIIRGEAFDAAYFRALYAVYTRLADARRDATDPPPDTGTVVDARLLYGAGEVCVLMPYLRGRNAKLGDLAPGGRAAVAVAGAIAWLARHGLLYVDLREPNVRVLDDGSSGGDVRLVDYDDCIPVDEPPATADDLIAMLVANNAAFVRAEGALGARPAVVAALREGWGEWAPRAHGR